MGSIPWLKSRSFSNGFELTWKEWDFEILIGIIGRLVDVRF